MEDFKLEFLQHIFGGISFATYAAAFIFTLIGIVISLRLYAEERDKLSPNTPYKFSWKFLLQDNLLRIMAGMLMVFIVFRFAPELLQNKLTMLFAFLLGLCSDSLIHLFQKIQNKAREKFDKM